MEDIQAIINELNYKKAQESLRAIVDRLDLNREEKQGLESSIDHLSTMLDKLDRSLVQIAVFGMVGRGKSSVLNALLGQEIFLTGPLHGVTQTVNSVTWKPKLSTSKAGLSVQSISLSGFSNGEVQLLDTPGIDEVDGEAREFLARQIAAQVDLILFIVAGDLTKVEYNALSKLREVGKPMLLVFNQIDRYPEADRLEIYRKITDERVKELLTPDEVVMVAASPLIARAIKDKNGNVKIERYRQEPQIDELKLKILEILHREGKALVALNTMLYTDTVNQQIVDRKMTIREEAANQLIQKTVMFKAMAIALNPVTALDLLTGAVIDVAMILSLSRLYGISMTQQGAIGLLQKIALSMGGISASELLTSFGLSSLKGVLGMTVPATGGMSLAPYLSIAIAQAGVAGFSSHAIGQVTKTYLANGASWGDGGPKAVVTSILRSLDETSIINRIKAELSAKISRKNELG